MMEVVKIVICLFCSIFLVQTKELPSYFTKCKKNDPKLNDCILKNIVDNWSTFIKGDDSYHIQKMDPLFVPFMQVKVDNNLKGNLTNANMFGYAQAEFRSVKLDLDKKTLDLESFWPISSILGTYEVTGKLIGLTIEDTGDTNVTFVRGTNEYHITYKLKEKKGKQHIQILESFLDNKDVERIYFHMKFSRNQQLGDSINEVLNENWKEVAEQVKASVGEALGGITKAILQPFFDKVSLDDMFQAD